MYHFLVIRGPFKVKSIFACVSYQQRDIPLVLAGLCEPTVRGPRLRPALPSLKPPSQAPVAAISGSAPRLFISGSVGNNPRSRKPASCLGAPMPKASTPIATVKAFGRELGNRVAETAGKRP
jgi:hypothetical protein